jgi:hypothetical protein
LTALAFGKFGVWWGIAIAVGSFALFVVVIGVNAASRGQARHTRRSRGPLFARLHAIGTGLLGSALGFGIAAATGIASGTVVGLLLTVVIENAMGEAIGWVLDMDWSGALGSWCLVMMIWLPLQVPLAAYLAPGYSVRGVAANLATLVLVIACNFLAWRASPWRYHWGRGGA